MAQEPSDPLESLLSLEDEYYTEGHTLGLADGARAGRIEGRIFGLQKGFEKYLEMGRLGGRAAVWRARTNLAASDGSEASTAARIDAIELSDRMQKHINRLSDLTDASALSTENAEDSVEEFEVRLRDAKAKAALISNLRAVGETDSDAGSANRPLKGRNVAARGNRGEMEDFAGSVPIANSKGKPDETTG